MKLEGLEELEYGILNFLSPGFHFNPKDEELILKYLNRMLMNMPLPVNRIRKVNVYDYSPLQLSEKFASFGEKSWYFFTPRDRKYPKGSRPNRGTGNGYWKASGAEKRITNKGKHVGFKQTLVYYEGKPKIGVKTSWIMHEYRSTFQKSDPASTKALKDMKLDDCVLCSIYNNASKSEKKLENGNAMTAPAIITKQEFPNDVQMQQPPLNQVHMFHSSYQQEMNLQNGNAMVGMLSSNEIQVPNPVQGVSNAAWMVQPNLVGFNYNDCSQSSVYNGPVNTYCCDDYMYEDDGLSSLANCFETEDNLGFLVDQISSDVALPQLAEDGLSSLTNWFETEDNLGFLVDQISLDVALPQLAEDGLSSLANCFETEDNLGFLVDQISLDVALPELPDVVDFPQSFHYPPMPEELNKEEPGFENQSS